MFTWEKDRLVKQDVSDDASDISAPMTKEIPDYLQEKRRQSIQSQDESQLRNILGVIE